MNSTKSVARFVLSGGSMGANSTSNFVRRFTFDNLALHGE